MISYESTSEDRELAEWAFQSHYWIEKEFSNSVGTYLECKYCNKFHPTTGSINKDYPLCKSNPLRR